MTTHLYQQTCRAKQSSIALRTCPCILAQDFVCFSIWTRVKIYQDFRSRDFSTDSANLLMNDREVIFPRAFVSEDVSWVSGIRPFFHWFACHDVSMSELTPFAKRVTLSRLIYYELLWYYVYRCIYIYVSIYRCIYIYISVYIYMYICMYINTYVYIYI